MSSCKATPHPFIVCIHEVAAPKQLALTTAGKGPPFWKKCPRCKKSIKPKHMPSRLPDSLAADERCRCNQSEKSMRHVMNPVQHYWLRNAKDDFTSMQRIYDTLQQQMQYFARLHTELRADMHECLLNLNSRLRQHAPAEDPSQTASSLVNEVHRQKLKIIRIEYTTLDDCVKACRHQQEMTTDTSKLKTWPFNNSVMLFAMPVILIGELHIKYTSHSEHDPDEEEGDEYQQWNYVLSQKYTEKVSICNGRIHVTKIGQNNSGAALTHLEGNRVYNQWYRQGWPGNGQPRLLWHVGTFEREISLWDGDDISHMMVYSESTEQLLLDLVQRLYNMELLPEDTSI